MSLQSGTLKAETLKAEFQLGETVYSAVEQDHRGMITGIILRAGYIVYLVSWAGEIATEAQHTAMELSREPVFGIPTR